MEACAHSFFDELREPGKTLPSGRSLPPLFDFTQQGTHHPARYIVGSMLLSRYVVKKILCLSRLAHPSLKGSVVEIYS